MIPATSKCRAPSGWGRLPAHWRKSRRLEDVRYVAESAAPKTSVCYSRRRNNETRNIQYAFAFRFESKNRSSCEVTLPYDEGEG
jgi:hypothetical protein